MSSSYGATTEVFRCIAGASSHSPRLCSSRSNLRFLTSPMTSKTLGGRSGKISISCSMSNSSGVKSMGDNTKGLTYKDAGVDIDAGSELVRRIAKMAPGIGGFGGLFPLGIEFFNSSIILIRKTKWLDIFFHLSLLLKLFNRSFCSLIKMLELFITHSQGHRFFS